MDKSANISNKERNSIICFVCRKYQLTKEDVFEFDKNEYMICPVCGSIFLLKPNDTIAMFPGETRFENKTVIYYLKTSTDFETFREKAKRRAERKLKYENKENM